MRLIRQSLRVNVPPDGGEHYWHEEGVKGFWSVIKPYGQAVVNAATNPSMEADGAGWVAINGASLLNDPNAALHGNKGWAVTTTTASQGVGYEMISQFSLNTTYCACISIDGPAGAIASFKFEHNPPPGSVVTITTPTIVTLPGYPIRICAKLNATPYSPFLPTLPIAVRFDRAGTYKVDGLVLTTTEDPVTSYFDGDSPDAVWLGAPHASASSTTGFSRILGERVNFNEVGFNITGGTGFGLAPKQLISSPFARLSGAHLQRVKDSPRIITLTGLFEGNDPSEIHAARNALIDALSWRFEDQCTQDLLLCYSLVDECGCQVSQELQIPATYQAGLEGIWGTLDRERTTLVFAANGQQSFASEFESSANLSINGTTIIDYEGTSPAWVNVHMWPGAGGMNVSEIHNDTTGHSVYFGTSASGGNPTALPLLFGPPIRQYAILHTDPAQKISLDLYEIAIPVTSSATITRIMHYIRYALSQVGMLRLVTGRNQIRAVAPLVSTGSRIFLTWKNKYKSVDHLCAGACVEAS